MRPNHFGTFFVAVLLMISSQVLTDANEKRVDEIKKNLACVCGCGMTLETCQGAMSCTTAEDMTSTIRELVHQGKTRQQIIEYFVDKYGEAVLAAPTKKGFNLTAWLLPFLGLLVGIWIVRTAIVKWVKKREEAVASIPAQETEQVDPKYRKKLHDELEKFED